MVGLHLKKYIRIIYKRIWMAVLISLVVSSSAAFLTFFLSDSMYEARLSFYTVNRRFDPQTAATGQDLTASHHLAQFYGEIAHSHLITDEVMKRLGLSGISAEHFLDRIEVRVNKDSNILHLSVWNRDPDNARYIADTLYDVLKEKALELTGSDLLHIINPVRVNNPLSPGRLSLVVLISVLGIVISIGVVLLLDYLDDSIKTPEDVNKVLGATVLGTIPDFKL